jgi:hypothetical protein
MRIPADMDDTPPRFEDEFPEQAQFLMGIFAIGAVARRLGGRMVVRRVDPYKPCPCGSGSKVKF